MLEIQFGEAQSVLYEARVVCDDNKTHCTIEPTTGTKTQPWMQFFSILVDHRNTQSKVQGNTTVDVFPIHLSLLPRDPKYKFQVQKKRNKKGAVLKSFINALRPYPIVLKKVHFPSWDIMARTTNNNDVQLTFTFLDSKVDKQAPQTVSLPLREFVPAGLV
jgi:hypothetical protein